MKRGDIIDKQELLDNSNGGRDIFEVELQRIPTKAINSPLRNDPKPSFKVFRGDNGIWFYKDMSTDEFGDCFNFLSKLYNISYRKALEKVKNGLNLEKGEKSVKIAKNPIIKETKIEFSDKSFTKDGHNYWNSFCLEEAFLRKSNIYQVKIYSINDRIIKIPENQSVFAYYAVDVDKVKLLTIGENVDRKWISNLKSSYLWYYYEYKEAIKDLFVVKSVKDRMVLKMLGYEGISLQNESATTFLKSNVEKVKKICERPIIVMGADNQGFQTSLDITNATGFRWFNSPKYMLRFGINDPASICQEFGIDILDKQIKKDLKKWK